MWYTTKLSGHMTYTVGEFYNVFAATIVLNVYYGNVVTVVTTDTVVAVVSNITCSVCWVI